MLGGRAHQVFKDVFNVFLCFAIIASSK
jgi:hypothetical protein